MSTFKKYRKHLWAGAAAASLTSIFLLGASAYQDRRTSVELENLTWVQAEKVLKEYEVVLIALGARTKEHGPHLPLKTDYIMAEYLKSRVAAEVPVAVLPTIQYGYYPSFLEYPGSVSIRAETFKNVVEDICRSMSGYGARKFYVLNTGISTLRPLEEAAETLKGVGIVLRYLNLLDVDKTIPQGLLKQEGGSHADEAETSMMLYIAPETVDMSQATKDYDSRPGRKGLTRNPHGSGTFSPTGSWGDPTLATREKGRIIVEATVQAIVGQVQDLIRYKIDGSPSRRPGPMDHGRVGKAELLFRGGRTFSFDMGF